MSGKSNQKATAPQLRVVEGEGAATEELPNAVESELQLLSICLQWPDEYLVEATRGGITGESFYQPANGAIWGRLVETFGTGEPVDLTAFTMWLKSAGRLEEVGGAHHVVKVWTAAVTGSLFKNRVEEVRAAEDRRKLVLASREAHAGAMELNGAPMDEASRLLAAMRQALGTNQKELGMAVPADGDSRPKVDVGQPLSALARQLGPVLAKHKFFRRAETRLVVKAEEGGRISPVNARRLRGAVGEHVYPVAFDRSREREVPKDISSDMAASLLETDRFLALLPELAAIAPVRMPVWTASGGVELCKPGYNEETGVYCADEVEFSDDYSLKEAADVFNELLGGFQWPSGEGWSRSRSGLLQMALMVGSFCSLLIPPGTPKPMAVYVANQPGAGKTLLACMANCAVHGIMASEDYPAGKSGQDELKKILDVAAIEQAPVLWFDDVPEFIKANALNRFIVAERHKPRILGRSEKLNVPAVTQVFMTGNHIRVTRDLIRRALVVELFVPGEIRDREFEVEFSMSYLAQDEIRKKILAACWAVVRNWAEKGCYRPRSAGLKGFSGWCGLVAGVMDAVLGKDDPDPFGEPELPTMGDEETEHMKRLLVAVAADYGEPGEVVEVTLDQIIEVARMQQVELFDGKGRDIIGNEGDAPLSAGQRQSLGAHLKKWRGRELGSKEGLIFTFGHRKQEKQRVYPIEFKTKSEVDRNSPASEGSENEREGEKETS